ncbi:MAG: hypothetical protein ACQESF_00675 [Nanobdellota archaeon]
MIDEIKKDILDILDKTVKALENHQTGKIRELSNHTIHNSSIYQDKDAINIAVVIYALSKLIEKHHDYLDIISKLKQAKEMLEKNDIKGYEDGLAGTVDIIYTFDKKINFYTKHIINRAGIKKGSRIYEHGISLARTAEILNISQWELAKYLGQTNIPDMQGNFGTTVDERLKYTRELFGIKNE